MTNIYDAIREFIRVNALEDALAAVDNVLAATPNDISAVILKAEIQAKRGDSPAAIGLLEPLLATSPSSGQVAYALGMLKHRADDRLGAIRALTVASKDPNYAPYAFYALGNLHEEYGEDRDPEAALYNYRKAVALTGAPEGAFIRLSGKESGERSRAILRKGLEEYPDSENLTYVLADKLSDGPDAESALSFLSAAEAQGVSSLRLKFLSAELLLAMDRNEEARVVANNLEAKSSADLHVVSLLRACICMGCGKFEDAGAVLTATAEADLENSLAYAPQFLLFATHLFAGNKAAAEAALAQINPTEAHDFSPAFGDEISGFHWSPHFWKAAERLIEDEPRSDAGVRIAALRGLDTAVSHLGGANRLKDLEIALTRWRYDYRLFAAKAETLLEENRHDEALDAFLRAQMLSDENLYIPWDSIIPTCVRTKSSRKSLVKAVTQCLADTAPLGGRRRFVQTGVEGLIRAIHDANAYDTNLELIELFTPAELAGAGLDFTVAYSLANNAVPNSERALRAIKLYEKLLRDAASVSAAGNNLGILYEEHGRLVDAEKAYLASVTANPQGSHAPASLLRVRAELEKIAAHERALVTAGEFFLREELTTQRVVQDIVNHIASDGAIHLKKDKLQKLLGASQYDLASRVQPFLTRRYFDLEKADSLQRDPVVLKPNPQLLAVIQRQHVEHDEELRRNAVAAGLAPGNLDQRYGFNAVLLERLNIVSSVALQAQLRRDMREAVHALVVGSHKSALILCGSISEALLYDRLSGMKAQSLETLKRLRTREGRKVKSSDRDLRTWSLETLLNVASELAIISQTLFYFGHGIRGYRNLVHPAVELRGILEVSEGNASIAWTVVKDLLKALHLSSDLGSGDTSH